MWNHNTHYHDLLWQQLPSKTDTALEIGCGTGGFSTRLATRFQEVDALDIDQPMIEEANRSNGRANITYHLADFITHDFGAKRYDAIVCIATLHHLPLEEAVTKMKGLLRPSGKLLILGLYREETFIDFLYSAISIPIHRYYQRQHNILTEAVTPPTKNAQQTIADIRKVAQKQLPTYSIKRHVLWRYSLIWTQPR